MAALRTTSKPECCSQHQRPRQWSRRVVPAAARRVPNSDRAGASLEVPALLLFAFDRFEQGLEVADAEAARAVALDDLEEERRAVLDRAG